MTIDQQIQELVKERNRKERRISNINKILDRLNAEVAETQKLIEMLLREKNGDDPCFKRPKW